MRARRECSVWWGTSPVSHTPAHKSSIPRISGWEWAREVLGPQLGQPTGCELSPGLLAPTLLPLHPGMGTAHLVVSLFSSWHCFGPRSLGLLFLAPLCVSLSDLSSPLISLIHFLFFLPSPHLLLFSPFSLILLPSFPFPMGPSLPPALQLIFLPFLPHFFSPTTSFLLPTQRPYENWRET